MVEAVIRRPAAADPMVVTAAASLVGSELIHVVVLPEHLREWWAAGVFFAVVSALEGGVAAAALFGPSRRVWQAALALSLATVAVWAWSRTAGLPFGPDPWTPEAVGRADVAASVLELATAAAAGALLRRPAAASGAPAGGRPSLATIEVLAVVALATAFGIQGAGAHAHHRGDAPPDPINVPR
jgi:hypothetical protein